MDHHKDLRSLILLLQETTTTPLRLVETKVLVSYQPGQLKTRTDLHKHQLSEDNQEGSQLDRLQTPTAAQKIPS